MTKVWSILKKIYSLYLKDLPDILRFASVLLD